MMKHVIKKLMWIFYFLIPLVFSMTFVLFCTLLITAYPIWLFFTDKQKLIHIGMYPWSIILASLFTLGLIGQLGIDLYEKFKKKK